MMKILQKILAALAKSIIKKYKPRIVGVTGSVGKSSTKEATVAVLRQRFHVRGNLKNYNNELGVPLTIIGAESGGSSIFGWTSIILKAFGLLIFKKHYPEILVLEMAADKKGDIAYLVNIAPPEIGVVTAVSVAHTEFFGDIEGVRKEKGTLVNFLPHTGRAVLNVDDELVKTMEKETRARVITYGFKDEADVRANDYNLHYKTGEDLRHAGTFFNISYEGGVVSIALLGVLGRQHVYAALAAAATGVAFGMSLAEIGLGLRGYAPPLGRMNLLAGVKKTILIDDTYNASPRATHEALETVRALDLGENERRIAILGDMKELGEYATDGHREVGRRVAEVGVDILVAVGELARDIARGAREAGMSEDKIFEFSNREEAGRFIQDRIHEGDVILIKGSQSMRMEGITKEIMAEPLRAQDLLVRQGKEWLS